MPETDERLPRSAGPRPENAFAADLFRREAGKIAAWLARLLGPSRLDLIEDAVQDAFGAALARWPEDGLPEQAATPTISAVKAAARDTRLMQIFMGLLQALMIQAYWSLYH